MRRGQTELVPAAWRTNLLSRIRSDHVQIYIGGDLLGVDDLAGQEVMRAQGPQLLSRPEGQHHVALPIHLGQLSGGGQHRRHPRGVVVGTVMDAANLVLAGQRVATAPPTA